MKTEDIAGKTPDELKKMLLDLKREQLNLRFQKSGGQLTNMSQVRKLRRQVAPYHLRGEQFSPIFFSSFEIH